VRRMKELIADGAVGEIHHLQAFQQNGQFLNPEKPFHWKMDAQRTGGGAIVEYGIHTLDLARWLVGDIASVSPMRQTIVPSRPDPAGGAREVKVDDSTSWLMAFESGATGVAHAGWATIGRAPGIELRVYGSAGALKCVLSDELPGAEGLWMATAE